MRCFLAWNQRIRIGEGLRRAIRLLRGAIRSWCGDDGLLRLRFGLDTCSNRQSGMRSSLTPYDQEAPAVGQRQLHIRAEIHHMRVAAVWQVLMPFAGEIRNVKITTGRARHHADFTVSFGCVPLASLHTLADRLRVMTWVTGASVTPG